MHASNLRLVQDEFERLYLQYKPGFVRIARMYVRDVMAAEDLVTESFLAFWESGDRNSVENAPAYLLATVKNRCLNWLRDRQRHLRMHDDLRTSARRMLEQHMYLVETTLPQTLRYSEICNIIERTLRQMPERTRRVFLAHRVEEMSYKEIEQLFGLSERQINYQIRTAKEALRAALKDYVPTLLLLALLR